MKRPARILVGTLAVIGGAYLIFALYATFLLPDCLYIPGATASSPNGRHIATFSQTQCDDSSLSNGRVTLGVAGKTEKSVVYDVKGTSDVDLTWNGDMELQVILPKSAATKRYHIDTGLPRVVEIRTP
jgi:hypothetical protein